MMSAFLILSVCLLSCLSPAFAMYNSSTIGYADNYNSNLSPNGKTTVWVSHNVRDISEVNDKDFSITLIVETMIGWNDNRIGINPEIFDSLSSNDRFV